MCYHTDAYIFARSIPDRGYPRRFSRNPFESLLKKNLVRVNFLLRSIFWVTVYDMSIISESLSVAPTASWIASTRITRLALRLSGLTQSTKKEKRKCAAISSIFIQHFYQSHRPWRYVRDEYRHDHVQPTDGKVYCGESVGLPIQHGPIQRKCQTRKFTRNAVSWDVSSNEEWYLKETNFREREYSSLCLSDFEVLTRVSEMRRPGKGLKKSKASGEDKTFQLESSSRFFKWCIAFWNALTWRSFTSSSRSFYQWLGIKFHCASSRGRWMISFTFSN